MSRRQGIIIATLAVLVMAVFGGLGYLVFTTMAGKPVFPVIGASHPQDSPEAVARAWIEAVVAGDCARAEDYIPPDQDGFFCGEDSERIVSATIELVDADVNRSPAMEYMVTLYGRFVLYLYPVSGAPDEMGQLYPVEVESVRLVVEEIDGKYYVSGLSSLFLMMHRPMR